MEEKNKQICLHYIWRIYTCHTSNKITNEKATTTNLSVIILIRISNILCLPLVNRSQRRKRIVHNSTLNQFLLIRYLGLEHCTGNKHE